MALEVEKLLAGGGIRYEIIELNNKAFTVADVVKYSKKGINPDEICKTIILKGKKTNKKYAVLLKGNDKIDFSEAKKLFSEEMTTADDMEVQEASGVEPGAVCPLLLNVPLFVDRKVLELEKINCGSGDHLYGLEIKSQDLKNIVNYQIINLVR